MPSLAMPPAPLSAPDELTTLACVSNVAVTLLGMGWIWADTSWMLPAAHCSVALLVKVIVPLVSALLAKSSVPPLMVVPPV